MAYLARHEPATQDLRIVAAVGFTGGVQRTRFRVGEGMIGRVAATREPYVSDDRDASVFLTEFLEREGITSFVHVPISLGPRLFGVLNVSSEQRGWFDATRLGTSSRSPAPRPARSPTRSTSSASAGSRTP